MALPDPIRRRAGYMSALSRIYMSVNDLFFYHGSKEEAEQLNDKLIERYAAYLESHELALASAPTEKEETLKKSHEFNKSRYYKALQELETYIVEGPQAVDDEESLHAASMFSQRTTTKRSGTRSHATRTSRTSVSKANSERISEARVQAELQRLKVQQMQDLQKKQTQLETEAAELEAIRRE